MMKQGGRHPTQTGWIKFFFYIFGSYVLFLAHTSTSFAKDKDLPNSPKWVHVTLIEGDFETITSFLKSSIEEEGLTIANQGNMADMLSRTKDALEVKQLVYKNAVIYQFCSAKLGAELFAISPLNIGACPLNIFAYELKTKPGIIHLGFRTPPISQSGPSANIFQEVNQLLTRIVKRTAE